METNQIDTIKNIHDRTSWQLSHYHHVYFRFTGNDCIAGKSFIVNKGGMFWLYMGDDPRRNPSTGIIVTGMMGGDLAYMSNDCKKEIEIMQHYEIKLT